MGRSHCRESGAGALTLDDSSPSVAILIGLVGALYAAVGHGGASGYLAVLSFTDMDSEVMRTTSLALNLVVATISFAFFRKAEGFKWSLALPLVLGSMPAAMLGAYLQIPQGIYQLLLGAVLLFAGWRLWGFGQKGESDRVYKAPGPIIGVVVGVCLGLLSGVVGVGGGIFLSPLLILTGWANPKATAATSAAFIFLNSASGLAGRYFGQGGVDLPDLMPWFVLAVGFGAIAGAWIGSQQLAGRGLKRLLAVVLLVAAGKLIYRLLFDLA